MSEELKPCPFCGCKMKMVVVGRDWLRLTPEVWHDDDCPIDGKEFDYSQSITISEAFRLWNMRAPQASEVDGE